MRRSGSLLTFVLGLVLLPGCGGANIASVRGVVTCKGSPVKEAHLTFAPIARSEDDKEPGKPATGFTNAEGVYVLSTYQELDGALIGNHRVTVTLDDTNPAARWARTRKFVLEVKPGDNQLDIKLDQ